MSFWLFFLTFDAKADSSSVTISSVPASSFLMMLPDGTDLFSGIIQFSMTAWCITTPKLPSLFLPWKPHCWILWNSCCQCYMGHEPLLNEILKRPFLSWRSSLQGDMYDSIVLDIHIILYNHRGYNVITVCLISSYHCIRTDENIPAYPYITYYDRWRMYVSWWWYKRCVCSCPVIINLYPF